MSAVKKIDLVSVEDYLAGELDSPIKHEYLGGYVYAITGARNSHNLIGTNVLGTLHGLLNWKKCRPYNSDTKIRVRQPSHIRFYYPDVSIICRPNSPMDSFHDEPIVLCEVLANQTRRLDEWEKKDAYLSVPSLGVYALVEQEMPLVTVYRRSKQGDFVREVYEGLEAVIPLPEAEIDLSLADIYEGVEFNPEPGDEDD